MLDRKIFLLLISIVFWQFSFAQNSLVHITSNEAHPLYKIEKKLKSGDKNAFFEIAPYFDSKKELTERFAWNHISAVNESQVAKRIVEVNSIFTDDEIQITDSTSSQDFVNFLNANLEKIVYSNYAGAFLILPLESRPVEVMFREITEEEKKTLKQEYQTILNSLKNAEIKSLIRQKDSKILLIIASELYKERDWLNTLSRYEPNVGKYIKLLQILTNCEIAVKGKYNKMTWHIEEEFHSIAALNLLCYFAANYSKFQWNEKKQIFENNEIEILPIGKEHALFQLLGNKKDSKGLDAYIQLTTCNPVIVAELADEYEYVNVVERNYALPQFPYRRLKQLVLLTEYCSKNEIDFEGSVHLKTAMEKLKNHRLSFSERRKLEDSLINNLTLNEITAFEYWALIYGNSWGLTYSAGRILDIFYSKNWNNLLKDEKHLNCYLKKSALFNRLGIIGICNNYLRKFINPSQDILVHLEKIQTSDEDIKRQIEKIVSGNILAPTKKKSETVSSTGNYDSEVKDLEKQLEKLIKNEKKSTETTDDAISKLLSQINYEQIPIALKMIENYKFETEWKKYSFMHRDWGFFMYSPYDKKNNFNKQKVRAEFLSLCSKLSEYELYAYFLDKAGIDYKTNNDLDFDKIYEMLKYDIVVAFVGGGGGSKDNEVYSLIKLLELTFNTTLGFPKKFCNSNNVYGCSSYARAKAWRRYFIDNNLLKTQHNEPVSFNYE